MGLSTEVPDEATQRHSRMMELLTFINLNEPRGATITQIQSHTLTVFGLKFKTTTKMVRELTLAGSCDLSAVPIPQDGFKPHIGLRPGSTYI